MLDCRGVRCHLLLLRVWPGYGALPRPEGLSVVTRMMGLILAVIGVQMLIEGNKGAFALSA